MKNTIKLLLIVFALSAVTFTSCKKEDFKNIIEKIKEGDKGDKDKGDKDGDKDDKDRDKGDKDGDKDDKDRDKGDKDKGRGGRNNDKDSTRRR